MIIQVACTVVVHMMTNCTNKHNGNPFAVCYLWTDNLLVIHLILMLILPLEG